MKRIVISLLLFLLAAPSLSLAAEERDRDTAQQIDALMKEALAKYHIPGASLAVVHRGQTVYQESWGTMSDGSAVTADTTFLIGSISKPLTALAMMMLAEEGKLKLEEPIETYLPWFTYQTDSGKSITVRHLLEQTSGIGAYEGMKVTDREDRNREKGIAQAAAELSGVKLSRTPGEAYEYNSANYLLLGSIVEAVSGQPFSAFMDTRIFSPLGMNRTTADYESAVSKGFVPGYTSWFGKPVKGYGLYDPSGAPYGYMSSSSADLAKFIKFMLYGGELMSEQGLKQLRTPPEPNRRYGLGWHFPRSGEKYPYHTGATPEYKSELFFIPEQELGAVLLMNKYHELEAVTYLSIMEGIRSIMKGESPRLAEMNASTQWMTLGVVILFTAVSVFSFIRLQRKKAINKPLWVCAGALSLITAAALIPLFTYSMGISWRTVGLFLPDIAFLVQCLIGVLAVHGLLTVIFVAAKRNGN
ncbi:serine hydrolase domain-containing protein [Paenibacillus tyrfis]|uniref:serine hydrolase domain-containing protein n=1 Tax=Paenibacillus tyrfis TaxID=1501230 RepID=UPI00209E7BD2|nr:serine hydrolase domain-containing protein [Paenibacillus tyrfis]MCP1308588.1 beta-lactamase family protein [Paenibacillus tyrfis]